MTHAPRVIVPPIDTYSPDDDWRQYAKCIGVDNSIFFPERGQPTWPAKLVCAECPVREPCLEAGMREHQGIWGGLSERERRKLRRQRAVA